MLRLPVRCTLRNERLSVAIGFVSIMSDKPFQSLAVVSSGSASVKALDQPLDGSTETRADGGETTIDKKAPTQLTGGPKRLRLPLAVLQAKAEHQLSGWNDSPWEYYKRIFNCDLAGDVSIATLRTYPSELRAIRTLKKEDSEDILEKFRTIRHENILLVRECFTYEDSVYMVFDDLPVTLDHVVACDYYPQDTQVLSALAQILSGLSFLHACGYDHQAVICSNILLGMDGTIQIDQSRSIDAVASITTLLMQKYTKSNGAKGIDNVDRWSVDSLAFQFLLKTDTAQSIDELKDVCSDHTTDRERSI
ncbi:hypothetical protein MAP00_002975 [Monascus purpureus]|nr:hypothetical protein MAP00_002975 [Monascus purpureus]